MGLLLKIVTGIFWNSPQRRLRTFWRLLGAVLIVGLLSLVVQFLFQVWGMIPGIFFGQLQANLLTVVGVWLAARLIDRRKFSDTGIFFNRDWWVDLGFGMFLGAALMAAIFLIENASGWIEITGTFQVGGETTGFPLAILLPIVFYIWVSIGEELLFRGYLLLNLAEGFRFRYLGPRGALISAWLFTSLIFGVLHAANPNATLVSSANIALAGLWLGLAYVFIGSLAIPLGIHFTWNFFQGNVFGLPVSGTRFFETSVFAINQSGPERWTGGAFGPEAGLLGLLAIMVGMLAVVAWLRFRYGRLSLYTAMALPPLEKPARESEAVQVESVSF